MTRLGAEAIRLDPDDGNHILVHPASDQSVKLVLEAGVDDPEGRSEFLWIRLPDGDLVLGVYPQSDTYCACEADAQFPSQLLPEILWCESCGKRPQFVHTQHAGLCTTCAAQLIDEQEASPT